MYKNKAIFCALLLSIWRLTVFYLGVIFEVKVDTSYKTEIAVIIIINLAFRCTLLDIGVPKFTSGQSLRYIKTGIITYDLKFILVKLNSLILNAPLVYVNRNGPLKLINKKNRENFQQSKQWVGPIIIL